MKLVQTTSPPERHPRFPGTTLPRLWPSLTPERQHQLAQCVAQLSLRLHHATRRLAAKEKPDASP